jgi:hypothetical protein
LNQQVRVNMTKFEALSACRLWNCSTSSFKNEYTLREFRSKLVSYVCAFQAFFWCHRK